MIYTNIVDIIEQEADMKVQVLCELGEGKSKQCLYKEVYGVGEATLEDRQFEVLEKPNLRIICSQCEVDITRNLIIITKTDYYCVQCFANLQEFPEEYLVRRALNATFTDSRWDMLDEIVLITAFKLWGFGNWGQIKEYLDYNGSPFPLSEIQSHFQNYYLNQPNDLPPFSSVTPVRPKYTFAKLNQEKYSMLHTKSAQMKRRDSKGEKSIPSFRSLSLISSSKDVGAEDGGVKIQEMEQQAKEQPRQVQRIEKQREKKNECSILGYNKKRREFQLGEYDYLAQNMLADLQFYDTDTKEEHQLKIQIIEEYNSRLQQRLKRRQFVIQYQLLDSQYEFNHQCKLSKDAAQFQSFMRFTNNSQQYRTLITEYTLYKRYEEYVTNLRRIRQRVSKEGKLQDAYEYMARKREKHIQEWQKNSNKKYKTKNRKVLTLRQDEGGNNIFVNEDGQKVDFTMDEDPSQIFHKAIKSEDSVTRIGNLKVKALYTAIDNPAYFSPQ